MSIRKFDSIKNTGCCCILWYYAFVLTGVSTFKTFINNFVWWFIKRICSCVYIFIASYSPWALSGSFAQFLHGRYSYSKYIICPWSITSPIKLLTEYASPDNLIGVSHYQIIRIQFRALNKNTAALRFCHNTGKY